MERIFLPISPDYVDHWDIWEAAREFIQNALDADSNMTVAFSNDSMVITSKGLLEPHTLLLGASDKGSDDIGQYGEGYKLAMLVLARMGARVQIYTGGSVWTPSFQEHPQLKTDCLAIDIESGWANDGFVKVAISDLDVESIAEVREKYLPMSDLSYEVVAEHNGSRVLQIPDNGEAHVRRVYVRGLFVCDLPEREGYKYSYDFEPSKIQLDRDRSSVSSWDLQYQATQILVAADKPELLADMVKEGSADISGCFGSIATHGAPNKDFTIQLRELTEANFIRAYGESAYPINKLWNDSKVDFYCTAARDAGLFPVIIEQHVYKLLGTEFIESRVPYVKEDSTKIHKTLRCIIDSFNDGSVDTANELNKLLNQTMIRGI